ncbi:MAG: hypothetical protein OES47_14645 [Acidobacteriota bacterium]|nr:hypothetical protein [Acidobacteriota bacterium]
MRRTALISGSLALSIALWTPAPGNAQDRGDCRGQKGSESSIVIAGPDEPGERMVVEGRVLESDGSTPVAGATVFVFHTDSQGYYSPGGMDEGDARLCGLMLTDEEGRYRFESIKPAHYATGDGPPAHVHYRVWGPEVRRQSFSLHFEGDSHLGERGRDASANPTWATTRPGVVGEDGVLRIERDLRLR